MLPLLTHADRHAPIAFRGGRCIDVNTFLADVARLVALLPAGAHMMNVCADRYHFLVGLAASMSAGKICLLPSNHTPESVRQMRAFAADVFCLTDTDSALDLPLLRYPDRAADEAALADVLELPMPHFPAEQTIAYVFTSGSTGAPVPHAKTWGALVRSIHTGAERLHLDDGRAYTVVGTVPPQHMFGFESTVLLPLQTGGALWAGKPFYPADISAALAAVPQPRVLVSTPFHLRTWIDAELDCPPLHCVLSATAPLAESLAAAVEERCAAPLLEIYGCTETGQIATRHPTECSEWRLLDSVRLSQEDVKSWVEGDFIHGRIELGDIIELIDTDRFALRGRSADLINIAGKRTSLAFLNQQLLAIPGVDDGVFLQPNSNDADGIGRLGALAVSRELSATDIVRALRERIDPLFLPRPLYVVERLPRNAAGKLPQRELLALWQQTHEQSQGRRH
jgi:acyl-coenzyme A synthetase/AMP-(fatty) acid ligase